VDRLFLSLALVTVLAVAAASLARAETRVAIIDTAYDTRPPSSTKSAEIRLN